MKWNERLLFNNYTKYKNSPIILLSCFTWRYLAPLSIGNKDKYFLNKW